MIYRKYISRYLIFLLILFFYGNNFCANKDSLNAKTKIVIAKVADKEITLDDFISRSEYTIRPRYCKGNTGIDKKIILNSLIAEKLLAIQSDIQGKLVQNPTFNDLMIGRKEQKMRMLLSYYEGDAKVKLDTNKIKKAFSLAGRSYKIEFFNIRDAELSQKLYKKYSRSGSAFQKIFGNLSDKDSIYIKEIGWASKETKKIHQALFSAKLKKNQMFGPINIDDSTNIFIKIDGWDDKVVITEKDVAERWNDVEEKLALDKADSIYDKFVLGVMSNKKLSFNPDVFKKVAKLLAPFYLNPKKEAESEFLNLEYNRGIETSDNHKLGDSFDEIKNEALFTVDGKIWTVSDFEKMVNTHPLVLRKSDFKNKFAKRLRNAIADLVRDKYLTDIAYKRGYNNNEIVKHYEQTWSDASIAFFQKLEYLQQVDVKEKKEMEIIENYLNPIIEPMLKKYSDQIEINVEEFNKINLTRIDMFTTQEQVPYPVYVPAFPQLTDYNKLDYGKKMDASAVQK